MTPVRATPLFHSLGLWSDPIARDGPEQMACDEAMLQGTTDPVLRIFRWTRPWVSAGYFVPWAEAAAVRPDLPVCRRWTGGGVVVHEGDLTFSLVVPRGEPWACLRPAESYQHLHEALAGALRNLGVEAGLSEEEEPAARECFARPVRHDILNAGKKIAGGAQRRTKAGLLHQGSIQVASLGAEAGEVIGGALAGSIFLWGPPPTLESAISGLVAAKYGREDFMRGSGAKAGPIPDPRG
jgi:lipoyl(octanoyl) transferase